MTHLILDAAGDIEATWTKHHAGGLLIPEHKCPTVLQNDRDAAEREALRLAREHMGGLFVIFAPVAIAKRVPEATHVNMRGEVLRTSNVARILAIAQLGDEIPF